MRFKSGFLIAWPLANILPKQIKMPRLAKAKGIQFNLKEMDPFMTNEKLAHSETARQLAQLTRTVIQTLEELGYRPRFLNLDGQLTRFGEKNWRWVVAHGNYDSDSKPYIHVLCGNFQTGEQLAFCAGAKNFKQEQCDEIASQIITSLKIVRTASITAGTPL